VSRLHLREERHRRGENLAYDQASAMPTAATSASPTSAAKLKQDTALVNLLRNAVEAASDEDGWAPLASVGHIITKQRPEFDSRNYGYAKLNELIAATTLFVLDRRSPGDGKAAIMYVRDKRHQDKKPGS
jgi:uracil phosphoribosyltransferase